MLLSIDYIANMIPQSVCLN